VGERIAISAGEFGWLWLTPVTHERASYSGAIIFIWIAAFVVLAYVLLHIRRTAINRVPIWDCGFEKLNNRMQYTATSFSMPIRRIFGFLFNIKEDVSVKRPSLQGLTPILYRAGEEGGLHYRLRVRDYFWGWIYRPVADVSFRISRGFGRLQQGRIQVYLIYSFITIIVLLVFFR